MKRRALVLIVALGAGLVVSVAHAARQGQAPTFRSSANAVMVDVSVRDKNRKIISNLKAEDFEVLDNGVAQAVDNVSYGKLPIDVTVALDISYSVTGTLLQRLRRGITQLMDDLGRQDRLKLMLFNMRVNRAVDLTANPKAVDLALQAVTASGSTALLDAISVSLASSSAPDRRQLLVFFTDGSDSSSVSTPLAVTTVARRSRATLSFVMPSAGNVAITSTTVGGSNLNQSVFSTMTMPARVDGFYSGLARETGGTIIPVGAGTDLSMIFRQVLNDFRSAYVLYFVAKGVEPGGYHTLDVRVKRPDMTVQARRGYWY